MDLLTQYQSIPQIPPASTEQIQSAIQIENAAIEYHINEMALSAGKMASAALNERYTYTFNNLNTHLIEAGYEAITTAKLVELLSKLTKLKPSELEEIGLRLEANKALWKDVTKEQSFFFNRMGFMIGKSTSLPTTGLFSFEKTGSQLNIAIPEDGNLLNYKFIHTIHKNSALIWKELHNAGLPVARILAFNIKSDTEAEVTSCFEGISVGLIERYFTDAMPPVMEIIRLQKQEILDYLEQQNIVHGHPHEGNFTVLFYKKAEFNQAQIANVNNIYPGQIICTSDLIEIMRHPNDWIPVVRLIDLDQIRRDDANSNQVL